MLDAAESWTFDGSADSYRTEPVRTIRTKKVPRNHVKAEATEHHPAQVEVYFEDIPVGLLVHDQVLPGAPGNPRPGADRPGEKLQAAVKFAREEANAAEVEDQHVGEAVFGYLFG